MVRQALANNHYVVVSILARTSFFFSVQMCISLLGSSTPSLTSNHRQIALFTHHLILNVWSEYVAPVFFSSHVCVCLCIFVLDSCLIVLWWMLSWFLLLDFNQYFCTFFLLLRECYVTLRPEINFLRIPPGKIIANKDNPIIESYESGSLQQPVFQ